jgi:2-(3-amino-3-carboxypropyl)histidine synthase
MEEVIKKLKKIKGKKIFVQFGEGLKLKIQEIAEKLEKHGFQVFLCLEPCYGACDIRDYEAKLLGCDAILHIGHEKFIRKTSLPVVYWEYFIETNPLPVLEKEFAKLKDFEKIGIITSIQFVKLIPIVKNFLEKNGKKVFVHKSLQYAGQILGCDLRAAKAIEKEVDCFLCISAGKFYGGGLVLITNKPVLNLDLEKGEIYSLENFKKKIEKILAWNRSLFDEAKNVGILVSWKKGQFKNPLQIKKEIEKFGKKVYILAMDEISPEKLDGLKLDILINTACPRIGIDDLEKFKIPVLNYDKFKNLDN